MMRLSIDGKPCDMAGTATLPTGFGIGDLAAAEGWRTGRTLTMQLPSTRANEAVFGASGCCFSAERFNGSRHIAVVEADGVVLFEGTACLLQSRSEHGGGGFTVRIVSGAPEWARRAAHTLLSEVGIDFSMQLTPENIATTWTGEREVRFLPVDRGGRQATVDGASLLPVEHPMMVDDYHPFISVTALVGAIFSEAGYRVQSRFLESGFARSLMLSGAYAGRDTAEQKRAADFFARRSSTVTAVANAVGKVYASPSILSASLGNIVDTANPLAADESGMLMDDTFSRGGSFCIDTDGYACFVAPKSMSVGFILHLEYKTSFRILSRTQLTGFDRVGEIGGAQMRFSLSNTYADHRASPEAGRAYRVMVFDHTAGRKYALCGVVNGGLESIALFSARSAVVTLPEGLNPASLYLRYAEPSTTLYRDYEDDWALYAGHVDECGTTSVKVDLRLPPREVAAGEKVLLDKFVFGGAEKGMAITLSTACSLRPYFSGTPGYGSTVGFADIANRSVRQIELLEAMQQMFSLVFHTDERSRTVCIEPLEEFYTSGEEGAVTDWSGRIDYSKPVVVSDAGIGVAQWRRFGYMQGDAASAALSRQEGSEFGAWMAENPLYGAADTVQSVTNPLFVTTVNGTGSCPTAPAASIPKVGDSDAGGDATLDTPFSPHIVCYAGLHPLPSDQLWGYPHNRSSYPLAAFHFAGDGYSAGFTLSFCDRDGVEGLHRFRDAQLCRERERQYLTLHLRLSPLDVARLASPDGASPSLRSTFRLGRAGQQSLYRLVAMKGYDPSAASTECTFIRLGQD